MIPDNSAMAMLRVRWGLLFLPASTLLCAFWVSIGKTLGPGLALRWLPPALLVAGVVLGLVYRQLEKNHTSEGQLLGTIGLPNLTTILRGLLVASTAGFIFIPYQQLMENPVFVWVPACVYVMALLLDLVDGGLARRFDRTTELGRRLDSQVDGLTVLCGSLLAVMWHKAPLAFILVGLAYYLFCSGCRLREYVSKPCRSLPPSRVRRLLAGTMMVTISVILFPPVSIDLGRILSSLIAVPFLVNFFKDWLAVSRLNTSFLKSS